MFSKLDGYKTKIIAVCILLISAASLVKDVLDGGGFNWQTHYSEIMGALGGLGLFALRSGVDRAITPK